MFQELTKLFVSANRVKLLKFFLLQPDERVSADTAGNAIGISKRVAVEEVRALHNLGILITRRKGRVVYYAVNDAHPLYEPLRKFIDATTVPDVRSIAKAFRGVRGLSLLVASGMLAREERSTIDLLIVARWPNDPSIAKAVRRAESAAAIPLRYAILETKDYDERLTARDRILRDVFEFGHIVVLGRR